MTPRLNKSDSLRRNLRAIYSDGIAFSVMAGSGEAYLAAFVLALGLSEVSSGLITAVPLLAGAVLQMISPLAVTRLKSHRRWVVACAAAQAVSFGPLVFFALRGEAPAWLVFVVAAVYWGSGMATGPAWNTWVETIVPTRIRAGYFARRSRAAQVALLASWIGAGMALQLGEQYQRPLTAFAVLFLVAGSCRAISAALLARTAEPIPLPHGQRAVRLREVFARLAPRGDLRLLRYMLIVTLTVYISAPYFTPYMIKSMELAYWQYAMLVATALLAKITVLPALGRLAARTGSSGWLLWTGGIGVIPLSALWCVANSFESLLILQFIAGAIWACYELATFLLLFETVPVHERTSVLTSHNLLNSLATLGGALVGAALLRWGGATERAYFIVFLGSSVARLITIPFLAMVSPMRVRPMAMPVRMLAVRPQLGSIDRLLMAGLDDEKSEVSGQKSAGGAP